MNFIFLTDLCISFIDRYLFFGQYAISNIFPFLCWSGSIFFHNFQVLIKTDILSLGCCIFLFLLYIDRILIHLSFNKVKDFLVFKISVLPAILAMFNHLVLSIFQFLFLTMIYLFLLFLIVYFSFIFKLTKF